jgi:hypothetical protein
VRTHPNGERKAGDEAGDEDRRRDPRRLLMLLMAEARRVGRIEQSQCPVSELPSSLPHARQGNSETKGTLADLKFSCGFCLAIALAHARQWKRQLRDATRATIAKPSEGTPRSSKISRTGQRPLILSFRCMMLASNGSLYSDRAADADDAG